MTKAVLTNPLELSDSLNTYFKQRISWLHRAMEMRFASLSFCEGNPAVTDSPHKEGVMRMVDSFTIVLSFLIHEKVVQQTAKLLIWDNVTLKWWQCNVIVGKMLTAHVYFHQGMINIDNIFRNVNHRAVLYSIFYECKVLSFMFLLMPDECFIK